MSQVIDLMPEACRIRLGRRAWVRGWIVRYTVAAIALVVVISGTEIREQAKRSRVAALQKQVDFSVEQKKKAEALQAKIAAYEAALDQHDALALPLTVGTALQTLASCTPESVTLTSLAMLPKTVRDRTVKPGEQGKENRWLLFELRGVSPSDTDLAQFLAALESDVIFSRATVDYTTQKDIYGIEAREFGITCEIDLERDFVFDEGGDAVKGHENGKLIVGLAVLVLLGLVLGVWPNMRSADRLDALAVDLSSRVERSDDGEAALGRLRETLAARTAQASETLKDIPRDGDVGGFIRAVSDEFGRLGLGRPEIKTGRPIESDEAQALPMTVEVHGGFLQLISAIDWVESINRLVRVRKITFTLATTPSREPLFGDPLDGELVLDVYYDPRILSPIADAGEGTR